LKAQTRPDVHRRQGFTVKYFVLIYGNPNTWSEARSLHAHLRRSVNERAIAIAEVDSVFRDITESGELLSSEPLAHPSTSRIVRLHDGEPVTIDGSYSSSGECLAGVILLDCEDFDRATAIAARFPDAHISTVEVRPVITLAGLEMEW
jgi:hypothetical protein